MIYNEGQVTTAMLTMINLADRNINSSVQIQRHFRNNFGVTAATVVTLWTKLNDMCEIPTNARIKHLLWMLSYFKTYGEYEQYCNWYKCAASTFRSWVWYFAKMVSELHVVSKVVLYFLKCIFLYLYSLYRLILKKGWYRTMAQSVR
jgi:hypothetical protein